MAYRYEVLRLLGKGSFGQVVKAFDHKEQRNVALKMVRNERRFHSQAKEEIRILDHLRSQDRDNRANIIHMFDHFQFRGHVCLTFELLSVNLYELTKKNNFKGFSLSLVRKFALSILQCLDLLAKHRIVHCDLKPENILLKQPGRSGIKVIDFGSSCFDNEQIYTYIQSRFYRAPEVILGGTYGTQIDTWSLGCILPEMLTGYPLFPGEDEGDQLACIFEILGMPEQKQIDVSKRARIFVSSQGHPRYCTYAQGPDGRYCLMGGKSKQGKHRGPPGSRKLESMMRKKCDDRMFVDFIRRSLDLNPSTRLTPTDGLRHPWISGRVAQGSGEHIESLNRQ